MLFVSLLNTSSTVNVFYPLQRLHYCAYGQLRALGVLWFKVHLPVSVRSRSRYTQQRMVPDESGTASGDSGIVYIEFDSSEAHHKPRRQEPRINLKTENLVWKDEIGRTH